MERKVSADGANTKLIGKILKLPDLIQIQMAITTVENGWDNFQDTSSLVR